MNFTHPFLSFAIDTAYCEPGTTKGYKHTKETLWIMNTGVEHFQTQVDTLVGLSVILTTSTLMNRCLSQP